MTLRFVLHSLLTMSRILSCCTVPFFESFCAYLFNLLPYICIVMSLQCLLKLGNCIPSRKSHSFVKLNFNKKRKNWIRWRNKTAIAILSDNFFFMANSVSITLLNPQMIMSILCLNLNSFQLIFIAFLSFY